MLMLVTHQALLITNWMIGHPKPLFDGHFFSLFLRLYQIPSYQTLSNVFGKVCG